jgi:hypothetical protein
VTADAELASALQAAAPHLPIGLSRAGQVRELALAGARHLASEHPTEAERRELLKGLAARFDEPTADSGIDWDALRQSKRDAWPSR